MLGRMWYWLVDRWPLVWKSSLIAAESDWVKTWDRQLRALIALRAERDDCRQLASEYLASAAKARADCHDSEVELRAAQLELECAKRLICMLTGVDRVVIEYLLGKR